MKNTAIQRIPERISDTEVLHILNSTDITSEYVGFIKEYTNLSDDQISDWLSINVKTLRTYKKSNIELKPNIQEQLILLISLFKHGEDVFGSIDQFNKWIALDNFYFEKKKPMDFLNTITGIRFVDDRLTAMEFGDNV